MIDIKSHPEYKGNEHCVNEWATWTELQCRLSQDYSAEHSMHRHELPSGICRELQGAIQAHRVTHHGSDRRCQPRQRKNDSMQHHHEMCRY